MTPPEPTIRERNRFRSFLDDPEEWIKYPTGGPVTKWLGGALVAALPIYKGVMGIQTGHMIMHGRNWRRVDLTGPACFWLAVSYIAFGALLHFHFFWGLSDRLWRWSNPAKIVTVFVLFATFFYGLYRFIV